METVIAHSTVPQDSSSSSSIKEFGRLRDNANADGGQ